jgi:putative FmdB family regulatory protein
VVSPYLHYILLYHNIINFKIDLFLIKGYYKSENRGEEVPNYDYKCQKCSHKFEVFQSMSDAPLKKCPECGGKVKRLIGGGAGIIFKGSGFYATDYKKAGKGDGKPSDACKSCKDDSCEMKKKDKKGGGK